MKNYIKKQWQNMLLLFFVLLLFIPQIRFPIQVQLQKILASTPDISALVNRGEAPVALEVIDIESNSIKRIEFNKKPSVINLWATWCPPCVAEMPSFQKLYSDYNDEVNFVFLSSEKTAIQLKFKTEKNYSFPLYKRPHNLPKVFDSNILPTTFVLNKKGQVVSKHSGVANWNAKDFRSYLDKLILE